MTDAAIPAQARDRSLRRLLHRIWVAALANRGLVVMILVLGVLQAFLTKAPFALLRPLVNSLMPEPGEPAEAAVTGFTAWFDEWFESFAFGVRDVLGVAFSGSPDDVRAMTLCLGAAVGAAVLGLFAAFAIYGTLTLARYFAVKIVVDLRNEIAEHVLRLPLRFFGVQRMGDLISHITNDATVLSRALSLACEHVVVDPLLVLGNMLLIVAFVPEAVWVLLVMVPVMALPLIRMGRKVQKSSTKSLAAMGDATESMNQMLSGIRTVKAFQLEKQRLAEFESNNANYLKRTARMFRAKALSQSLVFASYQLGFAGMLFGGGYLVLSGTYEFTQLAVALPAIATTYTHVKRLARAYNTLMESCGALDRVELLLDESVDAGANEGGIQLDRVTGAVAFEHVSFAYGSEPVLNDVSFVARPGEMVALVGPSGAGKSTALDLLARFHDPQEGRVLIDGKDLREVNLASYRQHLAIVSQQPFLFNTTIFENIAYGRPGASREEVHEAARVAQIHDFIMTLPEGYDSPAGERGCNLSGGQMQRITIARAMLRDPAILILDEATSALDSESEEAVQKALLNLMEGRTSFVIAHRLSTVSNADQILVMERGRIVEAGSHAALIEQEGLYSRLSQLQQLV